MAAPIIAISCVPWEYLRIAPQQTLRHFAKDRRVLYIDRSRSVAGLLKEPGKAFHDLRRCLGRPREVEPNLFVLTPPLALPWGARSRGSNRATMVLLVRWARSAQRHLGMDRPVLWSYLPQGCFAAGAFGETCTVYDVVDEYSAFPNMSVDMCRRMEAEMLRAADLVFAISPNLVADRRQQHERVFLCPIGADAEGFAAVPDDAPVPEVLRQGADDPEHPRIGYYGGIDDRVDYAFCEAAADALPRARFFYFGPVRRPDLIAGLLERPNVWAPGPLAYEDLPAHARFFDVCHLPYVLSRFNQYIFPNKIFEYLGTGNPVVSSPIPALTYLAEAGLLTIADTAESYVAALRAALEAGRGEAAYRQSVALANTWRNRARRMDAVIEAYHDGEKDPAVLAPMVEPDLARPGGSEA